jgi:hypothetical protein
MAKVIGYAFEDGRRRPMPEPSMTQSRWRLDGVRVVHANELDINTPP